MANQYGNSTYSKDELLRKKESAKRILTTNKDLPMEQKQQLLRLIKYVDTQLAVDTGISTDSPTTTVKTDGRGKGETIKIILVIIAIVFYLMSAIMAYKGYDKMTNYYHSENFSSLDVNAYVGGDAYNYIINGNYATGFFVLAMGFLVAVSSA